MKNRLAVLGALLTALPLFSADPQLKYVVIVSRHGVRSPTWDAERLQQYSAEPWPDWGVPPGDLTPHGREAILKMGAYYRRWLASEHLLSSTGCQSAGKIAIYADKDERTIETGKALAESILPGCGLTVASLAGGKLDPLFSGTFTPDPEASLKAVRDRLDPDLLAHHKAAFDALQFILGAGPKRVFDPASDVVKGSFATGSTLSENLLLEYANGTKNPGWGRLTKENLFQVLEIHAVYADLTRRTPYLAQRGANLLAHIRQSIEQAASGHAIEGAMGKPGDAILIISGHDTNQSNLSGLLGLSWKLPGYQPDDTPPGGALVFSLWQHTSGRQIVRLRYLAQTPDQMRNLESTAPESQDVSIPGCDPCTVPEFQRIVRQP